MTGFVGPQHEARHDAFIQGWSGRFVPSPRFEGGGEGLLPGRTGVGGDAGRRGRREA